MKVYTVYDGWHDDNVIARTYKGAVQYLINKGIILEDDCINVHEVLPDGTEVWEKSIEEVLGKNWCNIMVNEWTLEEFQKRFWGGFVEIHEVDLIEETPLDN